MENYEDKIDGTKPDTCDEDKISLKDNATFKEDSSVKENDSTGPPISGDDLSNTSKNVDADTTKVSDRRRCEPCLFDNMEVEAVSFCVNCAEFLCESCARDHRRSKLTRQHKLLSGDNLPESSIVFKNIKKLTSCPDHPDMVSSYQCHDHKAYICTTCVAVNHRKCDNVAQVTTPVARNADTEPDLKERIRLLLEKTVTAREIKEETISTLQLNHDETKSKRNDFKESIVRHIQNLFESSTNETEVLLNKELADLETDVQTCKSLEKEGNDERELLETTLLHGTPEEISIISNRIVHEAQRIEKEIELQTVKPKARLEFSENASFLDQKQLCYVTIKKKSNNNPGSNMVEMQMEKTSDACDEARDFMTRTLGKKVTNYDIGNDDLSQCTINSINVLNDGRIIALDETNKSLKVFKADYSVQMSNELDHMPIDMCLVSDNFVILVLKNVRRVVRYIVTNTFFLHHGDFPTKYHALSVATFDESSVAILFSDEEAGSDINSKSDKIEVQIRMYRTGHVLQTFYGL